VNAVGFPHLSVSSELSPVLCVKFLLFELFDCAKGIAFVILFPMFSETLLDYFRNPRNAGELPGAAVTVEVSNPVCGDILKLSARLEADRITEARFLCRGCTTSIACASLLTEKIAGHTLDEARKLTPETLSETLGGLPPATFHGALLAIDALQVLLARSL
jgi:nitrogen fixation protein NifU and related proteins